MNELLHQSWHDVLRPWRVDFTLADHTFEDIVQAYSTPDRFYHTLDHVLEVLTTIESLAPHADDLNTVKLAAWLHDVIYDSKASDNEEHSAQFAELLCEELSIPAGPRVAALILTTKAHQPDEDKDAQVLADADLAILGADELTYKAYAEKIRSEYAWVPDAEYRQGRRRVLGDYLIRPRIYHLLGHLEAPARRNLAAEIARLSAS